MFNLHYSNSQEDQAAGPSAQTDSCEHSAKDEGDDSFWGLDDIPGRLFMSFVLCNYCNICFAQVERNWPTHFAVEAKNLLDSATCKDTPPSHFVRPPANLVVLEGECLDVGGDGGELESYLVKSCYS